VSPIRNALGIMQIGGVLRRSASKVRRNGPCPCGCGSGKKYQAVLRRGDRELTSLSPQSSTTLRLLIQSRRENPRLLLVRNGRILTSNEKR
jgi:hypothetical protein